MNIPLLIITWLSLASYAIWAAVRISNLKVELEERRRKTHDEQR